MKKKFTRREWTAVLGVSAATAAAQTTPAVEDLTTVAAEQLRQRLEELRKFKLDMAAEPAVTFKP